MTRGSSITTGSTTRPSSPSRRRTTATSSTAGQAQEEHGVDLVVCVAAALRRGIKDEVLAPGFRISRPGPAGGRRHQGRPHRDLRRPGPEPSGVKKFMFVNRKAPYGTIYARAREPGSRADRRDLRPGREPRLPDDGVYELGQGPGHPRASASRTTAKTYRALDGYDVEKLCRRARIDGGAGSRRRPHRRRQVLPSAEMAALMAEQDVVLSF